MKCSERKGLISVIVPVFNVECYLSKCLDSILAQTYNSLDIIVIDDGSTDNSPKICDDYAIKDERIKVIHKKNDGLSSARNFGLGAMRGEYVTFVDSDDWIEPYMCEKLLNELIDNKCDVAFGLQYDNYEKGKELKQIYCVMEIDRIILDKENAMRAYLERKISGTACGILYNKSIFHDIRFPEGKQWEDQAIMFPLLNKIERAVICNSYVYHYFRRANSTTTVPFNVNKMHILEAFEPWFEYSSNNDDIFKKKIEEFYVNSAYSLLMSVELKFRGVNRIHVKRLVSIIRESEIHPNFGRLGKLFYYKLIPYQFVLIAIYFKNIIRKLLKRDSYV